MKALWKDNKRRDRETMTVWQGDHKYGRELQIEYVVIADHGTLTK